MGTEENKLNALIVILLIVGGIVVIGNIYYNGPKQINVQLSLDGKLFNGWVEVMNPSGEYLEEQSQMINGTYMSMKTYAQGRVLYVIAWVDLTYQIGNDLYVLGMRIPVTVQMESQSFNLSDGKLWLYSDNTTFGMPW